MVVDDSLGPATNISKQVQEGLENEKEVAEDEAFMRNTSMSGSKKHYIWWSLFSWISSYF